MIYGHIQGPAIDVETDAQGRVVAVWYRCRTLPFVQDLAWSSRVAEMRASYTKCPPPPIRAIDLDDDDQGPGPSLGVRLRRALTAFLAPA